MDEPHRTRLSLLGHPLRAGVLRMLVRRLPKAVAAGEVAEWLGVPPSTLSAHLAALTGAGLLVLERDGPVRRYRAAPEPLGEALGWARADLCLGRAGAAQAPLPAPVTMAFLCDDNAALSLIAEAVARHRLPGWVHLSSGGVTPAARADRLALEMLAARGLPLPVAAPHPLAGGAGIVVALSPVAAAALEDGPVRAYWPLHPPPEAGRLIPKAMVLHDAFCALDARLAALRRILRSDLPRGAVQAALDDLSSGLPAGDRACASLPEHRQRSASPAPQASAAS